VITLHASRCYTSLYCDINLNKSYMDFPDWLNYSCCIEEVMID
jgi:hypothetical protein